LEFPANVLDRQLDDGIVPGSGMDAEAMTA
jgi:hypothetical protein